MSVNLKGLALIGVILLASLKLVAQDGGERVVRKANLGGRSGFYVGVNDAARKSDLRGATILVVDGIDTTRYASAEMSLFIPISDMKSDTLQIVASYMGYKTLRTRIDKNRPEYIQFYLEKKTEQIAELKVQGKRYIMTFKGDTLKFNRNMVKTFEGAKLVELFESFPGFEFKNGLTFNGRKIKTLLINGGDVVADNIAMLLNNIKAEDVDDVEVFERETEYNRRNKKKDLEKDLVANVKTKQGKLFNNELQSGSLTHRLSAFDKKFNDKVVIKNNTEANLASMKNGGSLEMSATFHNDLTDKIGKRSFSLPVSYNKIAKDDRYQGSLKLSNSESKSYNMEKREYFQTPIIEEFNNASKNNSFTFNLSNNFSHFFKNNSNLSVSLPIDVDFSKADIWNDHLRSEKGIQNIGNSTSATKSNSFHTALSSSYQSELKKVGMSLNASFGGSFGCGHGTLSNLDSVSTIGLDKNIDGVNHNKNNSIRGSIAFGKYLFDKINLSLGLSMEGAKQDLFNKSTDVLNSVIDYVGSYNYDNTSFRYSPQLGVDYTIGKTKIMFGANTSVKNFRQDETFSGHDKFNTDIKFGGCSLSVKYFPRFLSSIRLDMGVGHGRSGFASGFSMGMSGTSLCFMELTPDMLNEKPNDQDLYNIQVGNSKLENPLLASGHFQFIRTLPRIGNINFDFLYYTYSKAIVRDSKFYSNGGTLGDTGYILVPGAIVHTWENAGRSNSMQFHFSFSRFLNAIKFKLSLKYGFSYDKSPFLSSGVLDYYKGVNNSISMGLTSSFSSKFKIDLDFHDNIRNIHQNGSDRRINSFNGSLFLKWAVTKHLQPFSMMEYNNVDDNMTSSNNTSNLNMNLSIPYKIEKKRYSLSISLFAHDLFNSSTFRNYENNTLYSYMSEYFTFGRQIGISMSVNFNKY